MGSQTVRERQRPVGVPAGEFRSALDAALAEADTDPVIGPVLRATGLRLRLRVPDLPLVVNIAASDDPAHHLEWSFDEDVDWEPALDLAMDSATANGFLQGVVSLAVGLTRGRVTCRGDTRETLGYLPATRLIAQRYRVLVRDRFPALALD